jgi:type VI secretion system ImpC/EvpB family protein
VDRFAELDPALDTGRLTDGPEYAGWRAFRQTEDSRFVGLAVPRVLLRPPHADPPGHGHRFPFRQPAGAGLYGSAAWAVAAVVARAFTESGWLANVRGTAGGAAPGLAQTDPRPEVGFAAPVAADAAFTDRQEKELADLGLIPLVHQPGAGGAVAYTVPSVQRPKGHDGAGATANARLSAMLPHVLCASRVAHYLKVLCRDRIGAFTSPPEVAEALRQWVRKYVVSNDSASQELKARHPLRDAQVEVWETPGRPGHYRCTMHLQPHYQLDALAAGIRLTTELTAGTG